MVSFDSDAGDVTHGVAEAVAQDLHEEVDGVAGQLALGPAPAGVFDDQAGIGGQLVVAGFTFDELEAAFLEQWNQRGDAGGADLFARPAWSGRA